MEMNIPKYDPDHLMHAFIDRAARLFVDRLLGGPSLNPTATHDAIPRLLSAPSLNPTAEHDATPTPSERRGKQRRAKRTHTAPRLVPEGAIVELIRERGPLRVLEIQEATGLTQSAAHKKVATLREAKVLKLVKEGNIVRYAIPPRRGRKPNGEVSP